MVAKKEYKKSLISEDEKTHEKREVEPWSEHIARKEHICSVCGLKIEKGERYMKYVRLPNYDEYFEDEPYQTFFYHVGCMNFFTKLYEAGISDEGFSDDDIENIFKMLSFIKQISVEQIKTDIRSGNLPSDEEIQKMKSLFELDIFDPEDVDVDKFINNDQKGE